MPDTQKATSCAHCGTPFTPRAAEAYCCHGCHYVAQLLEDKDLTRFYELKGSTTLPPVGSRAFRETNAGPLQEIVKAAEAASGKPVSTARFGIEGISCIGCVWLLEALFMRQEGAARARIDASTGSMELSWQTGHFDMPAFAATVQQTGYRLSPYEENPQYASETRQLTHRIGLCGFFLMNTMLFTLPTYLGMEADFFLAPLFQILGALFATLSLATGGSYFIRRAWLAIRNGVLHIDLPIATGLSVAYLGSLIGWATGYTKLIYFDFVATFVFLMLFGRWLQEVALDKNRNHLQRQQTGPREVTALGGARDGERIPVNEVDTGLEYSLRPGEINPVAADPIDDSGVLSLEWINGEADPVVWPQQRTAPAGAINVGMGNLSFRARESWGDSLLAQLLERPEDAYRDDRLQSVLKAYIGAVLAIALLGGMAWLASTGDVLKSTQVLISVLIVSCPCALGVALPMCDEFATARLRRAGLFIKNTQIWERLRRVNTVVFDKTGTLTMDVPQLVNLEAIRELDPLAAQALYQLVEPNLHPVARSLREALLAEHPLVRARDLEGCVTEHTGRGVAWTDAGGNEWTLGKPGWKDDSKSGGHTLLCQNGLLVAAFEFREDVRDDSRETIEFLRHQNLDTAILSGDAPERVQCIAKQLDLPEAQVRAACKPADKACWIEQHASGSALMIGDGANDSLAFDAAICRGTPVVDKSILEASADFFFFGRSLRCLPALFQTFKNRRRTVTSIFALAVTYNIAAVSICLAGLMHPLLAAVLMPLSSIATLAVAWFRLGRQPSNFS